MKTKLPKLTILGGGNIGLSLAKGLVKAGKYKAKDIIITRKNKTQLSEISSLGFSTAETNEAAVAKSELIVIAVLPQQLNDLLKSKNIFKEIQVVRAMPNTAIAIGESMTCIASSNASKENLALAKSLFETVGKVQEIPEEHMTAATALCACGVAFFLRAIRAASQGGIEIGFHADDALKMAAQTAKGSAALLLHSGSHPENEIDKVTSPEGCTIAGLNEMEHQGFSSALIKGITTSAAKAAGLYRKDGNLPVVN